MWRPGTVYNERAGEAFDRLVAWLSVRCDRRANCVDPYAMNLLPTEWLAVRLTADIVFIVAIAVTSLWTGEALREVGATSRSYMGKWWRVLWGIETALNSDQVRRVRSRTLITLSLMLAHQLVRVWIGVKGVESVKLFLVPK